MSPGCDASVGAAPERPQAAGSESALVSSRANPAGAGMRSRVLRVALTGCPPGRCGLAGEWGPRQQRAALGGSLPRQVHLQRGGEGAGGAV